MNDKKGRFKQELISTFGAIGFFLLTFFILDWNVVVSIVLSVILYFALGYFFAPVKKIGDVEVTKIEQGEEIKAIFDESKNKLKQLNAEALTVQDLMIKEKSQELVSIGEDIIGHLEKNYEKISPSRHFLDYYFGSAVKILNNYTDLDEGNVSREKMELIDEKTNESLDYLIEIFKKQRDSYYKDQYLELEQEASLLETTKDLGGKN